MAGQLEDIPRILAPVWWDVFRHCWPFAELCNGWLIGTRRPTSISRPPQSGCTLIVQPSHISLVLNWASSEHWPDLDPALVQALSVPGWRTFAIRTRASCLLHAPHNRR